MAGNEDTNKMETRFKMRTGALEFEFEGSEAFLTEQLAELVSTLASRSPQMTTLSAVQSGGGQTNANPLELTTASIAARLNTKSGPDLIVAACAQLTFVEGKEVFSRDDIIEKMKTATGYFKGTFVNNLTKYLQGLVKSGRLIERAAQTYSLSAAARSEVEAKVREP
jgi:hypothetical protein